MQMVKGLVSVIIPFHDRLPFLQETIESVLAQTREQWELWLVDDGSSDGSAGIALRYAAQHPGKIRYLEHPGHANLGVTRTRNLGASRSRGEFLAFLDSDDKWMPHKLAVQVEQMRTHPGAGLVYAPSVYWCDWDQRDGDQKVAAEMREENYIPRLAPSGREYKGSFLLTHTHPMGGWGAPCPSSLLIRRSLFDAVGGFVEEFNPRTFQLCEDTAFLTKVYLSGTHVWIGDSVSDYYRCHDGSIWQQTRGKDREELELKFYFQWLRQFLRSVDCKDKAIWKPVRRAGWMYWWHLPPALTRLLRRAANKWRSIRG